MRLEQVNHAVSCVRRIPTGSERETLALYCKLMEQVEGKSIQIEEYAREMVRTEEQHLGEVDKMLRKPGDIGKAGA